MSDIKYKGKNSVGDIVKATRGHCIALFSSSVKSDSKDGVITVKSFHDEVNENEKQFYEPDCDLSSSALSL